MRKSASALCAVLLFFAAVGAGKAGGDLCTTPVMTESGLVRGVSDERTDTCSWKGIPYAAPPVGELRWRAPQPHEKWEGVLEADHYGSPCIQVLARDLPMSEDCLYLNIWRPRKSGRFPVMLWIHGGGYVMGHGGAEGSELYGGGRLSEFGEVVVVTINYRLHALGFLAHPLLREEDPNRSTGNYGSLDQVAAIRWVHDNIENFGGDPDNITIFGESAGGWSICTMLATPLNRGHFHRAILESGGCEKSESLEEGYEQARELAERVGCDFNDLDCLRAVPPEKLLGGLAVTYREAMAWGPHHDGYLLTDIPLAMIRQGNYNRVPFMAGYNRNEVDAALILRPLIWNTPPSLYEHRLKRNLGLSEDELSRLVELYPLSEYMNKPRKAMGQMFTHASLACPTYRGLAAAARHQRDVYLYRFDYDEMKYGKFLGALHAMEVPFVFGGVSQGYPKSLYNEKNLSEATKLEHFIMSYWVNFAKTGNPNGPGLPEWPRFTPENPRLLVLDTVIKTEPPAIEKKCSFWEEYTAEKWRRPFEEGLARRQKKSASR